MTPDNKKLLARMNKARKKDWSRIKQDHLGEIRFMAEASGYVMVRRPRCIPFVLTRKEWDALAFISFERENPVAVEIRKGE